ncbi:MAG: hypothetical protein QNJ46_27215 [Leptolyngbyaceae cyanobacterium MO_188.B28]|nr:hypothetical protein [Leptolyngbyaceae cyanobacterium MO_188.B28]
MSQEVQYITNEAGKRVGVLLDLDTYRKLTSVESDPELLTSLSQEELLALAESTLSPETQSQLNEFLDRNAENQLSESDLKKLDQLLSQVDYLNILKTRARYTLNYLKALAS